MPELRGKFGLREKDIAEAAGATIRTVRRWKTQPGSDRASRFDDRIDWLYAITCTLSVAYPPALVRTWLRTPSPHLDMRQPNRMIAQDEGDQVLLAAQAVAAGVQPADFVGATNTAAPDATDPAESRGTGRRPRSPVAA